MAKRRPKKTKRPRPAKETGALSVKQQLFVTALVGEAKGNAAEAARIAGYRSRTDQGFARIGEENRRKPEIAKAIATALERLEAEGMATAVEVQTFLTGVMRGTACRSPVMTMAGPLRDEATGEIVTEPPEAKDRVKAASELVKVLGLAAPKKLEHSGTVETHITLSPEVEAALDDWLLVRNDPRVLAVIAEMKGET